MCVQQVCADDLSAIDAVMGTATEFGAFSAAHVDANSRCLLLIESLAIM